MCQCILLMNIKNAFMFLTPQSQMKINTVYNFKIYMI